jgi:hypothetical protein
MICSELCRFFMGSTGFTPQNSHSTPSNFWGLDYADCDRKPCGWWTASRGLGKAKVGDHLLMSRSGVDVAICQ